jgi:DNA-binding MarR family transcriptional regulator
VSTERDACGGAGARDASLDAAARLSAVTARAGYMMGENVERSWTPEHAMAWEGMLEFNHRFWRRADAESGDLSPSMLGIMGRLIRADARTLRQTDLADAMGLSLSRVSRITDILEQRGLIERKPSPTDARATNVTLTRSGLTLTRKAQDVVFAAVQEHFFGALSEAEVRTLAGIFARLLARPETAR